MARVTRWVSMGLCLALGIALVEPGQGVAQHAWRLEVSQRGAAIQLAEQAPEGSVTSSAPSYQESTRVQLALETARPRLNLRVLGFAELNMDTGSSNATLMTDGLGLSVQAATGEIDRLREAVLGDYFEGYVTLDGAYQAYPWLRLRAVAQPGIKLWLDPEEGSSSSLPPAELGMEGMSYQLVNQDAWNNAWSLSASALPYQGVAPEVTISRLVHRPFSCLEPTSGGDGIILLGQNFVNTYWQGAAEGAVSLSGAQSLGGVLRGMREENRLLEACVDQGMTGADWVFRHLSPGVVWQLKQPQVVYRAMGGGVAVWGWTRDDQGQLPSKADSVSIRPLIALEATRLTRRTSVKGTLSGEVSTLQGQLGPTYNLGGGLEASMAPRSMLSVLVGVSGFRAYQLVPADVQTTGLCLDGSVVGRASAQVAWRWRRWVGVRGEYAGAYQRLRTDTGCDLSARDGRYTRLFINTVAVYLSFYAGSDGMR